ncbi:hypothetical protein D9M68_633690 [compost metagenome]
MGSSFLHTILQHFVFLCYRTVIDNMLYGSGFLLPRIQLCIVMDNCFQYLLLVAPGLLRLLQLILHQPHIMLCFCIIFQV